MKRFMPFIILFSVIVWCNNHLLAQEVILSENSGKDLKSRWNDIIDGGEKADAYWAGYSIKRLMGENSFIGSHYRDETYPTLEALITGREAAPLQNKSRMDKAAFKWTDEESVEKVLKDVAILFLISKDDRIVEVTMNNVDLPFNPDGKNLYWLGPAEYDESVALLEQFFNDTDNSEVREDLICAVGIHTESKRGYSFLKQIVESEMHDELREQAVFWVAQQHNKSVLPLMKKTAMEDRSDDVREKAVFGLYVIDSEEATDVLIDLAKHGKGKHIREKAMFWLGQTASKKAVATIEDAVFNDEDTEIQQQAVFALSQLGTEESITKLIKVAESHHNPDIRKKAIFWLGQSDDERALDAIIGFLKH